MEFRYTIGNTYVFLKAKANERKEYAVKTRDLQHYFVF